MNVAEELGNRDKQTRSIRSRGLLLPNLIAGKIVTSRLLSYVALVLSPGVTPGLPISVYSSAQLYLIIFQNIN